MLYALFIYLAGLRRYIARDHKDLSVSDLKHLTWIVGGDGHVGDLKHKVVRRPLTVKLSVMSRGERSVKLLEDTTSASRVFGVFVDGARVIKFPSARCEILSLEWIWILFFM
jgi:hypothetical protein